LGVTRGELYLGVGDADEAFRATAIKLCEALARDFLKHFQDRHFAVQRPESRLLMVVLSGPAELAAFLGQNPGDDVRGIYDIDADWLVLCDNRAGPGGPKAERANTIALFHEATHQLCFHAGLLQRAGDVPLAVSEGLAAYGEVRSVNGRTPIGALNGPRRDVLRPLFDRAGRLLGTLFPLAGLLADDELLNQPATQQRAYAQSWALVHMLMQPDNQARMRNYLEAIKPRRNTHARLDDAARHLGDLGELGEQLTRYVGKMFRR
jgi:hypothetical protein